MTKLDTFGALKDHVNSTVEIYSYDGLNRLQEVRKGGTTVSYVYNAEGIRTSKTVNGITTEFLLDGANVVAETKNGSTTNYIRGVTGIISSSIQGTNNTTKYYISDGHGNITKLTDSSGSVVKTYTYDAFGVEQNIDSNDTNPFRYCGEYYDSEIGQIYLRARYYDPSLGRFTQSDPAMADGYNWYVYCSNDPINLFDPTGYIESNDRYITNYNTIKKLTLASLAYVVSAKYNLASSRGYNVNAEVAKSWREGASYNYSRTNTYSYTVVADAYCKADWFVYYGIIEEDSAQYSECLVMGLLYQIDNIDNISSGEKASASFSDLAGVVTGLDLPDFELRFSEQMAYSFLELSTAIEEAKRCAVDVNVSVDCSNEENGTISLLVTGYNGDDLVYSANVFEMELSAFYF